MDPDPWVIWCGRVADLDQELLTALDERTAADEGFRLGLLTADAPGATPPVPSPVSERAAVAQVQFSRGDRARARLPTIRGRSWDPEPTVNPVEWLADTLTDGRVHLGVGLDQTEHVLVSRLVDGALLDRDEGLARLAAAPTWDALDLALLRLCQEAEWVRPRPRELMLVLQDLQQQGQLAHPHAGGTPHDTRIARLVTVVRRLLRHHEYTRSRALLDLVLEPWRPDPVHGLHALAAQLQLATTGEAGESFEAAVRSVLRGADRAWAAHHADSAAELAVIGAGALLHRDLHAETAGSPLVEDAEATLGPFRDSAVMAALAGPADLWADSPSDLPVPAPVRAGVRRVLVLPGAYPRFATPLIEALRSEPDVEVEVLRLIDHYHFMRGVYPEPHLLALRLLASDPPAEPTADPILRDPAELCAEFGILATHLEALRSADVVFADWADKGAMWATLLARPGTRIVVRVHGVDAVSPWLHTLVWSRVDALISVSEHHADLVESVLRNAPADTHRKAPCQVVHNVVGLPPLEDPPPRDTHLLGMIGWGKEVKDPLWTLDVLSRLRAGDQRWRLRLVGAEFNPRRIPSTQRYAKEFAERLEHSDLAGAVELVPETDEVEREVARFGFIVSASRRESFHLGLIEGVLGGAVPVVRDWPFYASVGGAARLLPAQWVASDPQAAADRIRSLAHEPDRAAAAAAAAQDVARLFDRDATIRRLIDVVLGR